MKSLFAGIVFWLSTQAQAVPLNLLNDLVAGTKTNTVVSQALLGMTVTEINELETFRCLGCYKVEIKGTTSNGQDAKLEVTSTGIPEGGYTFEINTNTNDSAVKLDQNKVLSKILGPNVEELLSVIGEITSIEHLKLESVEKCPGCFTYSFSQQDKKALVQTQVQGHNLMISVRRAPAPTP